MNARRMAKALGRRGGRRRAVLLSAVERRRIASLGGKARASSLLAARRVAANLRYAGAVRDLQTPAPKATRLNAVDRLPGIYPADP